jgi:hypothetical protein
MSTKKFLTVVSGTTTLTEAPSSSAGAGDANKLIATNSSGLLDTTFLPPGVELQTVLLPTSETLTAGDFVNIFSNSGDPTARTVFLSATTAGGFSSTSPATPGANVILQRLGNAISATAIVFENDSFIALTV